ncbi:MAG: CDP-glucose 4,6-dehydratase [Elusimicrobia bacterium]|nr:CDP-glucose 4,6-dehydratase [Elusimicrobiota bacterium]
MEGAVTDPLAAAFHGKKVLVTGHTGFKGGWLCTWLKRLGAETVGYSLAPEPGRPSLFEEADVAPGMVSLTGDVRDAESLRAVFENHRPEVVFHLAAQALVRRAHKDPVGTFATNVQGTVNLLESVRATPSVRAVVIVTSDKCYENPGAQRPFRETDPLGGHEPYGASKAAAELVAAAYRGAYFGPRPSNGNGSARAPAGVATARAGNVIGGGDWAEDRILPDCVRALSDDKAVVLRHPESTRPWQHVLDPTAGYLWLAARLLQDPARHAGPWNFGPSSRNAVTVLEVARMAARAWASADVEPVVRREKGAPREASVLALDSSKAKRQLGWRAVYSCSEAVEEAVSWYRRRLVGKEDGRALTESQLEAYCARAKSTGLSWAGRASASAAKRKAKS